MIMIKGHALYYYYCIIGEPQLPFFGHILSANKDTLDWDRNLSKKYPTFLKRVLCGCFVVAFNDFDSFRKVYLIKNKIKNF